MKSINNFKVTVLFSLFLSSGLTLAQQSQNPKEHLRDLLNSQNITPLNVSRDTSSSLYKLGELLFTDKDLSGNRNISCQTCHLPEFGGGDALPLPIGEGGQGMGRGRTVNAGDIIPRNSPHLFNLGTVGKEVMFWDGRVSFNPSKKTFQTPEARLNGETPALKKYTQVLSSALSAQAMFPPTSHEEMRGKPGSNEIADAPSNQKVWELLTERIVRKSAYQKLLLKTFPNTKIEEINFAHLSEALAHFQANRFMVNDTPFDQFLAGDNNAMTVEATNGAVLFFSKAKCSQCHTGNHLTDNKFHNVAFPQIGPGKDEEGNDRGLYLITQKPEHMYQFKTPGLRNILLSAPYGHSGSLKTLRKVVVHYSHPMRSNHHYDGGFRSLPYELSIDWTNMNDRLRNIDPILGFRGVPLSQEEIDQITLFLSEGLTQKNF